jgi:hypothetical protein
VVTEDQEPEVPEFVLTETLVDFETPLKVAVIVLADEKPARARLSAAPKIRFRKDRNTGT